MQQEKVIEFLNTYQEKILNLEAKLQETVNNYHGLHGMIQEAKETYALIEKLYLESFKKKS